MPAVTAGVDGGNTTAYPDEIPGVDAEAPGVVEITRGVDERTTGVDNKTTRMDKDHDMTKQKQNTPILKHTSMNSKPS
jgi:hypothetical protein